VWASYGRYVKVQLVGTNYLNLAEVKVFSNINDGVFARVWHATAQSNDYLTYTAPGPIQRTAIPRYIPCNDSNSYPIDIEEEIHPGDILEFEIDRNSNNNEDETTFDPTIEFEPADAIGDVLATTTPTSVELHFNGFLKCPKGAECNYTSTQPPEYYTVQRLGTITSGSVFLGQLPNWAHCGPADRHCFEQARSSNFTVRDSTGISPKSLYKYKIQAFSGDKYPNGRLYGRARTIEIATGEIEPPSLGPTVSITDSSSEYGSRDAVISWQAPAPPLDRPNALERFELYRQGLSSATLLVRGDVGKTGTGEELCAQAAADGRLTCVASDAADGSCDTRFVYGGATCAAWDPLIRVGYTNWDRDNIRQVWVNDVDQGSPSRATTDEAGLIRSVVDPGVDRKPTSYRYYLVSRYRPTFASPTDISEMTAKTNLPRADLIAGFADAHVHQFANLAHGGTILDGRSGDEQDGSGYYIPTPRNMGDFLSNNTGKALRGCDAVADGGTGAHDVDIFPKYDFDIVGRIVGKFALDDTRAGITNLPTWLTYSNSLHQQVYKTALKRAVDGGMRLMVMHAVNSEFLCKAIGELRQNRVNCDDSESANLQITAAYRFQSEVDREAGCDVPDIGLPNTNLDNSCGWYRIVTTPAAARKAMKTGKLAVVLGLEVATPFRCGTGLSNGRYAGDYATDGTPNTRPTCTIGHSDSAYDILDPEKTWSLQYFYNRGVRHVFPVHGINNGLGSTAFFNPSSLYAYNQATVNGTWFRPGPCLNRGKDSGDGPMAYRINPKLELGLGPFGHLDFGALLGKDIKVPPGFPLYDILQPGGTDATCNQGGSYYDTTPSFGLTPLGKAVLREMMKRRMLIDVDHMSELTHLDAVEESKKTFNYPLVSGHANLQKISTFIGGEPDGNGGDPSSEVSLSTPELNEVRASGGQVNLVAVASFTKKAIAQYTRATEGNAANAQFGVRIKVNHDCDNSTKAWAQTYLAAVDLTRNAPMPNDNSAPGVFGVGFGSDFNTMMSMIQPRFGIQDGQWYGCSGNKSETPTDDQKAQIAEDMTGVDKAVQYDVDIIDGKSTLRGFGGISTALKAYPEINFGGFDGPILRRSRLNEGGYLFTLYGPDKPIVQAPLATTKCLDSRGWTRLGDWPRIGDCGDTANLNQQWLYTNNRIIPLEDQSKNMVLALDTNHTYILADSRCTSNCEWAVTYEPASTAPEGIWVTLPSGQLYNPQSNHCLGVLNHGHGDGDYVVAAPCAGNSFGRTLQPDQMWARGGEEESFNLTGLHHIGMYPDFIQDLKNIGVTDKDLVPLFQSAEGYLQMWERTGWTKAVDYTKLSSDGTWKFTSTGPAPGWQDIGFNDTTWRAVSDLYSSLVPYGQPPWYKDVVGFPLSTPAQWMPIADGNHTYYFRKTFVSDAINTAKTVTVSGDNLVNVYMDGISQARSANWRRPAVFTFTPSFFGTHVIAIEATNQGGPGGVIVDIR
jgi:microsomal dipeptidase-like Zn-dependent dipeptidase